VWNSRLNTFVSNRKSSRGKTPRGLRQPPPPSGGTRPPLKSDGRLGLPRTSPGKPRESGATVRGVLGRRPPGVLPGKARRHRSHRAEAWWAQRGSDIRCRSPLTRSVCELRAAVAKLKLDAQSMASEALVPPGNPSAPAMQRDCGQVHESTKPESGHLGFYRRGFFPRGESPLHKGEGKHSDFSTRASLLLADFTTKISPSKNFRGRVSGVSSDLGDVHPFTRRA